MAKRDSDLPGPSEAVHVSKNGRRSLCGQSMRGEPQLPNGTAVTCPACRRKNGCGPGCGCS